MPTRAWQLFFENQVVPINQVLRGSNCIQVRIDGKLSMYFYDIEAGTHTLQSTRIPPRSSPHMLNAVVDASNVPTGRTQHAKFVPPK